MLIDPMTSRGGCVVLKVYLCDDWVQECPNDSLGGCDNLSDDLRGSSTHSDEATV